MGRTFLGLVAALVLVVTASGGSSSDTTIPAVLPPVGAAAGLGLAVDNPYFPFTVGAKWLYEGTDQDETERIEVEVLADAAGTFTDVIVIPKWNPLEPGVVEGKSVIEGGSGRTELISFTPAP